MFSDILLLANFIVNVVTKYKERNKGWKRLYQLYQALGDVIDKSSALLARVRSLPVGENFADGQIPPRVWERRRAIVNQRCQDLMHSVKRFLTQFERMEEVLEIYDPEIREKLWFYFSKKGVLINLMIGNDPVAQHRPGLIPAWMETDSQIFYRQTIKTLEISDVKEYVESIPRYALHRANIVDKFLMEERIDLDTREKLTALIDLSTTNLEELMKTHRQLADFIRDNCSIEDLL